MVQSPRIHSAPVPGFVFQLVPELKEEEDSLPEWYNAHDNNDGTKRLDGLHDDALPFLKNFLEEQPSFDVVCGHSQGAQLAAILTLLMENDDKFVPQDKRWRATVHFNAANAFHTVASLKEQLAKKCNGGKILTPSVHVLGGPSDMTLEGSLAMLQQHYSSDKVTTIHHTEGHFLPKDKDVCAEIVTAIQKMLHHA